MARKKRPEHFVVDGSNIATEGRSVPSLQHLNEAVLAFMEDHPDAIITVVVDATFGHRIDKKEVKAFDEAVANNELVTPPAGAIGRGDAFVLSIAEKAGAGVLSNDSFQEFHGEYEWLFDEGRLIGGKPVPHVGWVFVARTPVRGPKSRKAVRDAQQSKGDGASARKATVRKAAPGTAPKVGDVMEPDTESTVVEAKKSPGSGQVNELMPFLDFVEHHPVGTSCTGVVESYSSHGAYARVEDVLVYLPLRLMDDPPPRSAKSTLKLGEAVAIVIVGYVPDRRSVDAALPHMADVALREADAPDAVPAPGDAPAEKPSRRRRKKAAAEAPAEEKPSRRRRKKAASPVVDDDGQVVESQPAPDEQAVTQETSPAESAKPTRKRATKKKAAAKPADDAEAPETPDSPTPARKKPAVKKKAAAKKKAAGKKPAAKKSPAKKPAAKKTAAAKKSAAKKTTAKRAAAKKSATKKKAAADKASGGDGS